MLDPHYTGTDDEKSVVWRVIAALCRSPEQFVVCVAGQRKGLPVGDEGLF